MILKRVNKHLDFSTKEELREFFETNIIKEVAFIQYELIHNGTRYVDKLKDYKMLDNNMTFDEFVRFVKKHKLKTIEISPNEHMLLCFIKSNVDKQRNREELIITFRD